MGPTETATIIFISPAEWRFELARILNLAGRRRWHLGKERQLVSFAAFMLSRGGQTVAPVGGHDQPVQWAAIWRSLYMQIAARKCALLTWRLCRPLFVCRPRPSLSLVGKQARASGRPAPGDVESAAISCRKSVGRQVSRLRQQRRRRQPRRPQWRPNI